MNRHHFINSTPLLHVVYCEVCGNQAAADHCHCALFSKKTIPFGTFEVHHEIELLNISLVGVLPEGDPNRLDMHNPLTRQDLIDSRSAIERDAL